VLAVVLLVVLVRRALALGGNSPLVALLDADHVGMVILERECDEAGQYVETMSLESVLAVFEQAEVPVLTASEVAEELDCPRPSAYNKLEDLVERGELHKKKVGARAVVYIRLDE